MPNTINFINSFKSCSKIINGTLIHNLNLISTIHVSGKYSTLQHYKDYLPQDSTKPDRIVNNELVVQSIEDRAIGLVNNFPISEKPKVIGIIPYFNDNVVKLGRECQTQISWLVNTQSVEQADLTRNLS